MQDCLNTRLKGITGPCRCVEAHHGAFGMIGGNQGHCEDCSGARLCHAIRTDGSPGVMPEGDNHRQIMAKHNATVFPSDSGLGACLRAGGGGGARGRGSSFCTSTDHHRLPSDDDRQPPPVPAVPLPCQAVLSDRTTLLAIATPAQPPPPETPSPNQKSCVFWEFPAPLWCL